MMEKMLFRFWCAGVLIAVCMIFTGGNAGTSCRSRASSEGLAQVPKNILLDFSAGWCGPCNAMSPIVAKLESQGYPIRKVDVDAERALASQFNVSGIPCFVLVADGKEVERIRGMTDESTLLAMMAKLPKANPDPSGVANNPPENPDPLPVIQPGVDSDPQPVIEKSIQNEATQVESKKVEPSHQIKISPFNRQGGMNVGLGGRK